MFFKGLPTKLNEKQMRNWDTDIFKKNLYYNSKL
jgi:hypothetical protein